MRPRVIPAEVYVHGAVAILAGQDFNEAAGYPRGSLDGALIEIKKDDRLQ